MHLHWNIFSTIDHRRLSEAKEKQENRDGSHNDELFSQIHQLSAEDFCTIVIDAISEFLYPNQRVSLVDRRRFVLGSLKIKALDSDTPSS